MNDMSAPAKENTDRVKLPRFKGILWSVAFFSAIANLLMLTGPLFMLQIYDRVLMSQSVPTLLALGLIVAILFAFFGLLEFIRGRVMARLGKLLDHHLKEPAFVHTITAPLKGGQYANTQPLQDLQQVRRFLASPAALTLFDLPWIPFYLLIVFLLHPVLGWVATGGGILLILVAVLNERFSAQALNEAQEQSQAEMGLSQSARRSAESITALGMIGAMQNRFSDHHSKAMEAGDRAAGYTAFFGSITKASRLAIQSLILGTGAYLAIGQEISPGAMIAASIVFARALAPVEQTIGQWRFIATARSSWNRLKMTLQSSVDIEPEAKLPLPSQNLIARHLTVAAPGGKTALINDIGFSLQAGEGMGIVGNSGSGKSTLAKVLVGAWSIGHGEIRLDGAMLEQWPQEILGRTIGYMPQESELFDGTISDNIARFDQEIDFKNVMAAGELSDAHQMILNLPDGYDTWVGSGGIQLSAGQKQRICLARAVYGGPFLIVLDEPNSNLDAEGDAALNRAISRLKENGAIVIVIAHRTNILRNLDKLLVLNEGQIQLFGPREEVFEQLKKIALDQRKQKGLRIVN